MNNSQDGFIGLNIERAASDIEGFDNAAKYAAECIMRSFSQLYNVLNNNWGSPIAVEFTNSNSSIIIENASSMARTIDDIYQGAVSAAISLASANGSSFPLSPSIRGTSISYELIPCKDNLDGRVGMEIAAVTAGLDEFDNSIRAALNQLSGVPDGIAFYDPEGNLIGGYHKNIVQFKEKFSELANATSVKMREYVQEEQNKIEQAKQQAEDVLNNSNGVNSNGVNSSSADKDGVTPVMDDDSYEDAVSRVSTSDGTTDKDWVTGVVDDDSYKDKSPRVSASDGKSGGHGF